MAGSRPAKKDLLTASQVCDLYLVHSEKEHEEHTFEWHQTYLQAFCDRLGTVKPADLIPFHLTSLLDAHPKWKAARRLAAIIVKRAFHCAKRHGLIAANPFADFMVEPGGRRGRVVSKTEREQILAAIKDRQFREFVHAMSETGCRPSEVSRVTAADANLELGVWVLHRHKDRQAPRRLPHARHGRDDPATRGRVPRGADLPGPRGKKPFTRNGIRCQFRRLREKLPHLKGVVAAAYRASFATDALENGVGVAQVAELLGHSDTTMVMKHYSMLSQRVGYLRDMAKKATGA